MVTWLDPAQYIFPDAETADANGIVAIGGDTSPLRLLSAYRQGIFPWPHKGYPLLWFSPDPRFVLKPRDVNLGRSLKKVLKKTSLIIRADTCFRQVMKACQQVSRPDQNGSWITEDMIENYTTLFHQGLAHSIEAYSENQLVGGLYGISLGAAFFGESMFFLESHSSTVSFVCLAAHLAFWNFSFMDCQTPSPHLKRLGATPWPRTLFLRELKKALEQPTRKGPWSFHLSPKQALDYLCSFRHSSPIDRS